VFRPFEERVAVGEERSQLFEFIRGVHVRCPRSSILDPRSSMSVAQPGG
jgi:hypothetical protein